MKMKFIICGSFHEINLKEIYVIFQPDKEEGCVYRKHDIPRRRVRQFINWAQNEEDLSFFVVQNY